MNKDFLKKTTFTMAHLLALSLLAVAAWAQLNGVMTGTVKDTSGAVIPGAAVTVKNIETAATRTVESDASGSYNVPSLPVGPYEVSVEKTGFRREVRRGITLVVGQEAVVNLTLEVGNVEQQVTVTAEAALVNTTLSSTSGLVNEKQVKDLPLNGRSFDQLLTLNTGTVNYSSNISKGTHTGFSVSGRRQEENRFLVDGMDYVSVEASGQFVMPLGASGELLGVDAVREFNAVQNSYGAEYGKRAGGQIGIVTSSGTNQLHGSAFEFLRNSKLDARNFFDQPLGVRIPPFKRNQFGGTLGGPLKKDKLFLFGNYEGFRQRLGVSDVEFVPDALARQGFLPIGPNQTEIQVPNLKSGMLPYFSFWPQPNGPVLGAGLAVSYNNPLQKIQEDFALTRFDHNISASDSLGGTYLISNGENDTPTTATFLATSITRNQLLSLQQTHIFSPSLINVANFGFSRAANISQTVPTFPYSPSLDFIKGAGPGGIGIGGAVPGATTASSIATETGAARVHSVRNFFNWADNMRYVKGKHSLSVGLWIQRIQFNVNSGSSFLVGSVSYPSLQAFLTDAPTQFLAIPDPHGGYFHTTEAAWYVQDEIKLKPNLTLSLGLRDEMTSGYNEAKGRCANFVYDPNGVIITDPLIGPSCLTQNNAISLWQPRVGLAWDPTGTGTWAVRAGVGIYNDLQDNLVHRLIVNPPLNSRVTLRGPLLSTAVGIPIPAGTPPPPSCNAQLQAANVPCSIFQVGGVESNMHTPTIQSWSLTVEREIAKNLALQLGYVGSQTYHLPIFTDQNVAPPQRCANQGGCPSGGTKGAVGLAPAGTLYMPPGPTPNPYISYTQSWVYEGNSSYHALNASLVKRSSHGLAFKANYTFSKALDLDSGITGSTNQNAPPTPQNIFVLGLSKGIAAFSIQHQFNANFTYELPFGRGQRWGGGASQWKDKVIGGWQWNGILSAASGFPFTPQIGANNSGTGDGSNPDLPNWNPAFSGKVIVSDPNRWFNPSAFQMPIAGTFGNVSRGRLTGPGLTTFDTSLFKKFSINEKWSLQFRAEAFNILNHANFGSPSSVVFSGVNISASAGRISSTATTSRQFQFALKLMF